MSDKTKEQVPPPEEETVTTQHTLEINGETIEYTAVAGTYLLQEEDEEKGIKAKATIFYTAYTRTDVSADKPRPITFAFNGGPGSSSVWLHMGLLGPRRVLMDAMGNTLPPPHQTIDNEFTLLDVTDLVFIDPVSTGYSRAVQGEDVKQFHGFKKDIASVGEFIRLYVTRNQRWSSPKYLIGESYGTTRAAGLSGFLQNECGMFLNGLMLVSSILNFQTADFHIGNDLPFILFLPTYCATAWYHGCLDETLQADLEATLAQVESLALNEYSLALLQGDMLAAEDRADVITQLARFTGLSAEYLDRTNLRIEIGRFTKQLLREQGRTVGRLDSRFHGIDRDNAGEKYEFDPSYINILGCYTACLNDYLRRELNYESDLPYEILTGKVRPWSYKEFENRYVDVAETLRSAMTRNPHLKVLVANGYYDLATPYFATEYTFNHLGLAPELRDNVSMTYYEAGHMMYVHHDSLVQLKDDLSKFINNISL